MADTVRHMDEYAGNIDRWFQANVGKLTWLAIVLVLVLVTDRLVSRVLRKVLDNSQIPSASIFVNLARVTIWVTGAAMVLQPVFGINPTTLITALGVGGVAISLGLKDTVANIIGGFGLMLGHVIQPGDLVTVQGVTGTVHDITWRQTAVRTRNGDLMIIPNSVLNTAALTKLTPVSEGMSTLEFTAKASSDQSGYPRPCDQGDRQCVFGRAAASGQIHRLLALWHDRPSTGIRTRRRAAVHCDGCRRARHRRSRLSCRRRRLSRQHLTILASLSEGSCQTK